MTEPDMMEPLAELARWAFDHAEGLCSPTQGCAAYHRCWSLVRHLDLGGELPIGRGFLARELPGAARGRDLQVLVAGAADSGLAALVLGAARPLGYDPELLVVDRCETPLAQNRRFAAAVGARLTTQHADVADLEAGDFDAVVLHNVLFFVPPDQRSRFLAGAFRALRPGGRLLCVQRLHDGPVGPVSRKSADRGSAGDIALAARAAAEGFGGGSVTDVVTALDAFRSYDAPRWTLSEEAMRALLVGAGFDGIRVAPLEDGLAASPRARPGVAEAGGRAGVVACRPE